MQSDVLPYCTVANGEDARESRRRGKMIREREHHCARTKKGAKDGEKTDDSGYCRRS